MGSFNVIFSSFSNFGALPISYFSFLTFYNLTCLIKQNFTLHAIQLFTITCFLSTTTLTPHFSFLFSNFFSIFSLTDFTFISETFAFYKTGKMALSHSIHFIFFFVFALHLQMQTLFPCLNLYEFTPHYIYIVFTVLSYPNFFQASHFFSLLALFYFVQNNSTVVPTNQ